MNSIYESLVSLGYTLVISGNYYRTKALYRGGNNPTALSFHKDTGKFYDFTTQQGGSWEDFLKLVLGNDEKALTKFKINHEVPESFFAINKINYMKYKVYPEEVLSRLLPLYDFYLKRGISLKTLQLFEAGFATNGQMTNRIVFPIRDANNRIMGFAGRMIIENDKYPKWLIRGPKNYFCYPIHINKQYINKIKEIILVESIGDVLALWEAGIFNALCTFGLNINGETLKQLIASSPNRIIISLNDDKESKKNWGGIASEKAKDKLNNFFNPESVIMSCPPNCDFGDSKKEEIVLWYKNLCQTK